MLNLNYHHHHYHYHHHLSEILDLPLQMEEE